MTGPKHPHHKPKSKFVAPGGDTPPPPKPVNEGFLKRLGFSDASIVKLERVDAELVKIVQRTKQILLQQGHNFETQIVDGFRTAKQQHADYVKGASGCDGYRNKSDHQLQKAVDIAVYRNGKYIADGADAAYRYLASAFKQAAGELGCTPDWGGDWKKKKDWDHYALKGDTGSRIAGPVRKPREGSGKACKEPTVIEQYLDNLLPKLPEPMETLMRPWRQKAPGCK